MSIRIWKVAMVEIIEEKRSRGRPRVRSDEETRSIVTEAASRMFHDIGYSATSVADIAQRAGVSTKTLYRLFPAKSDLFESVCAERIERFMLEANTGQAPLTDMNASLVHILEAFGRLTLDPDTIAIYRLVVTEADRFPEVAAAFYKRAILGTAKVIDGWIDSRRQTGEILIGDTSTAGGMLRGMMMFEPQRGVMLNQRKPPSLEEVRQRAELCADIFIRGCVAGVGSRERQVRTKIIGTPEP
jgi:AcrR family transcriptional regulator